MVANAALRYALDKAVAEYIDNESHAAHRVYLGEVQKDGSPTGELGVVVAVPKKRRAQKLDTRDILPSRINDVRVDVRALPMARPEILMVEDMPQFEAFGSTDEHRDCHRYLVRGGAQIQPTRANWVGTLGCMMIFEGKIVGAITNRHVTGISASPGVKMHQPTDDSNPFGRLYRHAPWDSARNSQNRLDLALLDCELPNGKHSCTPQQIGLGRLGTKAVDAQVGMAATKTGRTTGVTSGRCVGTDGVSLVSYGEGLTLRFVDLDVYESSAGDFSKAGDSGSAILAAGSLDLMSLLFAGGGGQTLGCRSRHVIDFAKGTFHE